KAGLLAEAGLDRLLVVNDFTAQALAQADPSAHGNLPILDGAGIATAPLLVIGPGTGLGVSALVPAGDGYIPIEGEGGHVGMSPQSADEMALFAALRHEVGHVSAEHFVSGPGLETVYRLQTDAVMAAPQLVVVALLLAWGLAWSAAAVALALAAPAVRAALAMRLAVLAALARCLAALPVVVWQPAAYALLPTL
ncbi:MAG: glucokinase, partial [Pseudomonadota bacterium]|nr:glucokinase [Pseudomonadota bacterium]